MAPQGREHQGARLHVLPWVLPSSVTEVEDGPWRRGDVGEGGARAVEASKIGHDRKRRCGVGQASYDSRSVSGTAAGDMRLCADIANCSGSI